MYNPNRSITATPTGVYVNYTDSDKVERIQYSKSDIKNEKPEKPVYSTNISKRVYRTKKQNEIYFNLVHGLKFYSPEDLDKVPYVKKMEIKEKNLHVQRRLTHWKFQIIEQNVGAVIKTVFHHSKFGRKFSEYPLKYNRWDSSTISFSQLGISRLQIEKKLIEWNFMPKNYFDLV